MAFEFIAVNTDAQALHHSRAAKKIQIGKDATRWFRRRSRSNCLARRLPKNQLTNSSALQGADMVFVTWCAVVELAVGRSVVAKVAKRNEALVVGFATKPLLLKAKKRRRNA
jgi:cell division protein FtsZ